MLKSEHLDGQLLLLGVNSRVIECGLDHCDDDGFEERNWGLLRKERDRACVVMSYGRMH